MDTEYVTLKNLEVLDKWVGIPQNQYKETTKRSVWLSEAGTCSPSYENEDLQNQVAGFAYGWKKINALEGISGIQWHSWFDHLGDGARLGLRKLGMNLIMVKLNRCGQRIRKLAPMKKKVALSSICRE